MVRKRNQRDVKISVEVGEESSSSKEEKTSPPKSPKTSPPKSPKTSPPKSPKTSSPKSSRASPPQSPKSSPNSPKSPKSSPNSPKSSSKSPRERKSSSSDPEKSPRLKSSKDTLSLRRQKRGQTTAAAKAHHKSETVKGKIAKPDDVDKLPPSVRESSPVTKLSDKLDQSSIVPSKVQKTNVSKHVRITQDLPSTSRNLRSESNIYPKAATNTGVEQTEPLKDKKEGIEKLVRVLQNINIIKKGFSAFSRHLQIGEKNYHKTATKYTTSMYNDTTEFVVPPRYEGRHAFTRSATRPPVSEDIQRRGEPGPSGSAMPGPSGSAMPGPSGSAMPGPSGSAMPGPSGSAMPGPSGSAMPGPSGSAMPGLREGESPPDRSESPTFVKMTDSSVATLRKRESRSLSPSIGTRRRSPLLRQPNVDQENPPEENLQSINVRGYDQATKMLANKYRTMSDDKRPKDSDKK